MKRWSKLIRHWSDPVVTIYVSICVAHDLLPRAVRNLASRYVTRDDNRHQFVHERIRRRVTKSRHYETFLLFEFLIYQHFHLTHSERC